MGFPAGDLSVAELVGEAFGVRDATIRALLAELEAERSRQRADALAQKLGLRNRFQLAHLLSRDDLPSLTGLRAILRVVTCVHRWETLGSPLARQALTETRDPAAWSKAVRRTTGRCWREIRNRGARAVATDLAARFRGGSST
jgi:hypothetical protein